MAGMAALSMGGSYLKGREEEAQAESTADILEYNKAVEMENATASEYAAEAEAGKIARAERQALGKARTFWGKSGFTMAGSPLSYMNDLVTQYELDRATELWKGDVQASKYRSQGAIYGASAQAQRDKAKTAIPRALLGGAIQAGSIYAGSQIKRG
jgi:hypothetical protein